MLEVVTFCLSLFEKKLRLFFLIVASIVQESSNLAAPFCLGVLINLIIAQPRSLNDVYVPLLCLLVALVAKAWAEFYMNVSYPNLQADSSYYLEKKLYNHIQHLPFTFFKDLDAAKIRKQIDTDCNGMSEFVIKDFVSALKFFATALISFFILLSINVYIAFITVAFAVITTLIYRWFNEYLYKITFDFNDDLAKYNSAAMEQLTQAPLIKRHNLFDFHARILDERFVTIRTSMHKYGMGFGKVFLIFGHISALITMLMLATTGYLALSGQMQFGFIATCFSYYTILSEAIQYFYLDFGQSVQNVKVYYDRTIELFSKVEDICAPGEISDVDSISISNLSFSYTPEQPVLKGLTTEFKKGCAYHIKGVNGSGKSTLLKLIDAEYLGLYGGDILLNGRDIETLNQYTLRSQKVIYVEQKPPILPASLWDNIFMYNSCAQISEATHYLTVLHGAYLLDNAKQNIIDPAATELSGGELQKIAIVRALLAHPDVLLLDEPSSALDADSARALVDVLNEVKQDAIVIFISHDEKLEAAADVVLTLEKLYEE